MPGLDGYGVLKIDAGLRSTRNIRRDGFMLMHVRRLGTNRGCMLRVCYPFCDSQLYDANCLQDGNTSFHTVSPSQ
jgi:hypothetical protein